MNSEAVRGLLDAVGLDDRDFKAKMRGQTVDIIDNRIDYRDSDVYAYILFKKGVKPRTG